MIFRRKAREAVARLSDGAIDPLVVFVPALLPALHFDARDETRAVSAATVGPQGVARDGLRDIQAADHALGAVEGVLRRLHASS